MGELGAVSSAVTVRCVGVAGAAQLLAWTRWQCTLGVAVQKEGIARGLRQTWKVGRQGLCGSAQVQWHTLSERRWLASV